MPTAQLTDDLTVESMTAWRRVCEPKRSARPHIWALKNIWQDKGTQFPGRFDADRAPWINVPLERMADNAVRDVSLMAAAQASKSYLATLHVAYAAANDPGEAIWASCDKDEVKKFGKDKLKTMLEACPELKEQLDRHRQNAGEYTLDGMQIQLVSSKAWGQLFSKTIRYLYLDEVHTYKPGVLQTILKRTRAVWNCRRTIISRPNDWQDDVHNFFLQGDQNHYMVPCLKCGGFNEMKPSCIRWDENEDTNPRSSEWNWPALFDTLRYECPLCGKSVAGTEAQRREMARGGQWKSFNPTAPIDSASFTWSAVLPYWVNWREIVKEFIQARDNSRAYYFEPLKVFVRETAGDPWQDRSQGEESKLAEGPYILSDKWSEAIWKGMAVDSQAKEQWAVIRSFNETADSRLEWEGKIQTWEGVRTLQEEFGVVDGSVIVDGAGGGPRVDAALQEANKWGWTVFIGDKQRKWRHEIKKPNGKTETVWKPWSPPHTMDSRIGTRDEGSGLYKAYYWSNPTIYDVLQGLMSQRTKINGHSVGFWLPKGISEEYKWQLESWHKILIHSEKIGRDVWTWQKRSSSRPDHLRDCECMVLVAAMMLGIFNLPGIISGDTGESKQTEKGQK